MRSRRSSARSRSIATLGDDAAVGRCTRILSRLHWFAGDGAAAREAAFEAIAILEPLGESIELARAYSGVSQLEMLAEDLDATLVWGTRALELATRARRRADARARARQHRHARGSTRTARPRRCSRRTPSPRLPGDRHEAARALDNLGYSLFGWVRPEEALRYAEQAAAYGTGHELLIIASYAAVVVAWLRLRAGDVGRGRAAARGARSRAA